jgi:hypothetical protein
MKKLAIPVIFLFGFSISAFTLYDITYPRKSTSNSELLDYLVPSAYPTIQSAVNAAVDEGEYREAVIATGLKNLKLIGRKARILPPQVHTI